MNAKTTTAAKRAAKPAAKPAARSTSKSAAKATAVETVTTEVKEQVSAVVDKARASSRNVLLAGLGAVSMARKAREERMNNLVAEGKRFEPKFKKAVEELKAKMQPKEGSTFDLSKFKLDGKKFNFEQFKLGGKKFDRAAIDARVAEGLGNALHRLGLPTRKEVDALAKKVDKLAELQRA